LGGGDAQGEEFVIAGSSGFVSWLCFVFFFLIQVSSFSIIPLQSLGLETLVFISWLLRFLYN